MKNQVQPVKELAPFGERPSYVMDDQTHSYSYRIDAILADGHCPFTRDELIQLIEKAHECTTNLGRQFLAACLVTAKKQSHMHPEAGQAFLKALASVFGSDVEQKRQLFYRFFCDIARDGAVGRLGDAPVRGKKPQPKRTPIPKGRPARGHST